MQQFNNNLQKSRIASLYGIEDPLEKGGGEGSRGGKVIDHTKSGRPIYEHRNNKDGGAHHFSQYIPGTRRDEGSRNAAKRHSLSFEDGKHGIIIDTGGVYKHFLIDKDKDKHEVRNVSRSEYKKYTKVKSKSFAEENPSHRLVTLRSGR